MPHATVEYSDSDRVNCCHCNGFIQKGVIKMGYHYWNGTDWYHSGCFILSDKPFSYTNGRGYKFCQIQHWANMSIRWKGQSYLYAHWMDPLKERDQEKVRLILNQYRINKARLELPKHVSQMKVNELKIELKKRHLFATGNKFELQQRLKDYFQTGFCFKQRKEDNHKLVTGYFRRVMKQCKLSIPIVLESLTVSFFPTFVL